MTDQNTIKKLQILLPHWIEHNDNHIAEFRKWEGEAKRESEHDVARLLDKAIDNMEETGKALSKALENIGGPSEENHHHH